MIKNGVVKTVEHDLASVIMIKGEQCAGCTSCNAFGEGTFEIVALNMRGAKPGDHVEIEVNPKHAVSHSAIVFMLPIVNLIIGYFLGSSFLAKIGLAAEVAGVIGSLGLMLITFVGIVGYGRIIRRTAPINAHINQIL